MNQVDQDYQGAVDSRASQLLNMEAEQLRCLPPYGEFETVILGRTVKGGWWHNTLSDETHHIYFKLAKPVWLVLYKTYLSGIKVLPDSTLALLSDEELGDYD